MAGDGKEWFIACPWGRIAIIAWGDCRDPPVLLCHGKLDTALTFGPLIRLLPKNYYYIALDLPGCGKSDWMPQGMPISTYDLVYVVKTVIDHFRWKSLIYIGHSLGALIGYQYHAVCPNRITRLVLLDPIPAYDRHEPEEMYYWYKKYIGMYFSEENFHKYNAKKETAPLYTKEKVIENIMKSRLLTRELAEELSERATERVGDLYRFTFDQRMKKVTRPPLSYKAMEQAYTSVKIPILTIVARDCIKWCLYRGKELVFEADKYPLGNYRVYKVDGFHDVHMTNPERILPLVIQGMEGSVVSKM